MPAPAIAKGADEWGGKILSSWSKETQTVATNNNLIHPPDLMESALP